MSVKSIIKKIITLFQSKTVVKVTINTVLPSERFVGKKVLVTGGSSGIGLEIAKEFLAEGAEVMITGRKKERLEEAKQELNNPLLKTIEWDVADVKLLDTKFVTAVSEMGQIDIFINNAGVWEEPYWETITEECYDKICDTNAKGLFFMCQQEGVYLKNNGIQGHIVNICSVEGMMSKFQPYTVSKWSSIAITQGAAKELVKNGIIVNGVAPGLVATNISAWSRSKNISEDAYVEAQKTHRFTTVEEIASMALYLSSDMASNIIGQVIAIDGGWVLN